MKYRRLGKTNLHVSVVGVGAWQFGGEWGRDFTQPEVDNILAVAREAGINLIDTAECYGDHLSERLIAPTIRNGRDKWIVATKFGHKYHGRFSRSDRWSPDEVTRQLEESLRALNTDYIDLYQFHSGHPKFFRNPRLWSTLKRHVKSGKIRYLGISIGSNSNHNQTAQATRVGASAIQVAYNRLDRAPEEQVFASCIQQDLGVLARVPLASGLLTGKYRPGDRFDNPNDVRVNANPEKISELLQEAERISLEEVPEGVEMAAWALAWCLQHEAVTCVIPGCKTPEQARANAAAAGLDMVREDHRQAVEKGGAAVRSESKLAEMGARIWRRFGKKP